MSSARAPARPQHPPLQGLLPRASLKARAVSRTTYPSSSTGSCRADALIIASPVYFLGAHASVKRLLDRAFSFFSACGEDLGKASPPRQYVRDERQDRRRSPGPSHPCLLSRSRSKGKRQPAGCLARRDPGDEEARRMRVRLGKLLFTEGREEREARACPFCGNDIIRMRRRDLSAPSATGRFPSMRGGAPVKGSPGWDVGNIEFVRAHREWLKGMKERFLASRKALAALSLPYKDIGVWIEPAPRPVEKASDEM